MAFIAQDHTRYGPYSIAYIIWILSPNSETSFLRAESLVQSNFDVFILKKDYSAFYCAFRIELTANFWGALI